MKDEKLVSAIASILRSGRSDASPEAMAKTIITFIRACGHTIEESNA
jgi:hypothetical protein